jgi:hypothetical protein
MTTININWNAEQLQDYFQNNDVKNIEFDTCYKKLDEHYSEIMDKILDLSNLRFEILNKISILNTNYKLRLGNNTIKPEINNDDESIEDIDEQLNDKKGRKKKNKIDVDVDNEIIDKTNKKSTKKQLENNNSDDDEQQQPVQKQSKERKKTTKNNNNDEVNIQTETVEPEPTKKNITKKSSVKQSDIKTNNDLVVDSVNKNDNDSVIKSNELDVNKKTTKKTPVKESVKEPVKESTKESVKESAKETTKEKQEIKTETVNKKTGTRNKK